MFIYQLISENLSGLGSPMGTECTWENFSKPFSTMDKAKAYAQKDYNKSCPKEVLEWHKETYGERTGDLGFVMYYIKKIKVE